LACWGPARSLPSARAAAPPASAAQGEGSATPGREIVIAGSTTVEPIARRFADDYSAEHPGVHIRIGATGSGDGARALIDGKCDIACMSRSMTVEEYRAAALRRVHPVFHVVAIDGIAVVVHPDNPVGAASLDQLRKVFGGTITNWKEVGGEDRRIVVIARNSASGTGDFFASAVMKGGSVKASECVESNAAVRAYVLGTPGAIGYVGLGSLHGLKIVAVDGIRASPETVAAGKYAISRSLLMVTNGRPEPGSAVHQLVTMQQTARGRDIVRDCGFVPAEEFGTPTLRQSAEEYWPRFAGGLLLTFAALLAAACTTRLNARRRKTVAAGSEFYEGMKQ
jgi:phosphate transport system substrate-binding protein